MDTLTEKTYATFDYVSRYAGVPCFYDTLRDRDVMGIGTDMRRDTAWVAHEVKPGDTLDSLALKYYNNPTYWWVIAYFNNADPFDALQAKYRIIKIPSISSIEFGRERQ